MRKSGARAGCFCWALTGTSTRAPVLVRAAAALELREAPTQAHVSSSATADSTGLSRRTRPGRYLLSNSPACTARSKSRAGSRDRWEQPAFQADAPAATGRITICMMLRLMPLASTGTRWPSISRASSGVATTPQAVESAVSTMLRGACSGSTR